MLVQFFQIPSDAEKTAQDLRRLLCSLLWNLNRLEINRHLNLGQSVLSCEDGEGKSVHVGWVEYNKLFILDNWQWCVTQDTEAKHKLLG